LRARDEVPELVSRIPVTTSRTRAPNLLGRSSAFALALTLVLIQQAAAIAWTDPVYVLGSTPLHKYGPKSMAVTGTQRVHVFLTDPEGGWVSDAVYRRSGDGGLTWADAVILGQRGDGESAEAMAIRRFGLSTLDALWAREGHLYLSTSLNNGFAWADPVDVAPQSGAGAADVARFADVVAVVWANYPYDVRVKVSTDGGETFGPATTLGSHDVDQEEWGSPTVINKNGTITVAWIEKWSIFGDPARLVIRRSTNGGATWRPRQVVAEGLRPYTALSMLGAGANKIVVGYTREGQDGRVVVRRSFDKGAHWGEELVVGGLESEDISLAYRGGALRATYITGNDVKFKTSTDFGLTWSPSSILSPLPGDEYTKAGSVGALADGRSVVTYWRNEIYARTTQAE
jgi:hypothetical protein